MNSHDEGQFIGGAILLLFIAGIAGLAYVVRNLKTALQQRILVSVLLIVILFALNHLWQFNSPDARGSDERTAFEFWRILVTFICVVWGATAIIAIVADYKKK